MTNRTLIQVRYAETDQMGVVYYANYLVWMEIGRTNLLREIGITYREMEENGIILPVAKAFSKYVSPALYDDSVAIYSTVTALTSARIRIDYKICRVNGNKDETLLCLGFTEHAFVSRETRKVVKAPDYVTKKVVIPTDVENYQTKI